MAHSGIDATAYLGSMAPRRVRRPVWLDITEHMYPLEPSPEQAWPPNAFRAFSQLSAKDLLIIGSGNGLDALGAAELLDLRSLTITDLYPDALKTIRENVLNNLLNSEIALRFYAGSLLTPIPQDEHFDLVYENLPNIPAPPEIRAELQVGTNTGRFFDASTSHVPSPFAEYLLSPPLPGYVRAEAETGVQFRYYTSEAIQLAATARRAGLEGAALQTAIASDLANMTLTATEAHVQTERGHRVAHSVLMLLGRTT